jgi:hypothetical protein
MAKGVSVGFLAGGHISHAGRAGVGGANTPTVPHIPSSREVPEMGAGSWRCIGSLVRGLLAVTTPGLTGKQTMTFRAHQRVVRHCTP